MDFSDDAYALALASEALSTYPTDAQLKQMVEVQTRIVEKIEEGRSNATNWQKELDNVERLSEEEHATVMDQVRSEMSKTENGIDELNNQKSAIFKPLVKVAEQPLPLNVQPHFN